MNLRVESAAGSQDLWSGHASAGHTSRWSLAGRRAYLWVEDPERLSLEIGRDIFNGVSIADLILLRGHIAHVRHQKRIIKPLERMVRR